MIPSIDGQNILGVDYQSQLTRESAQNSFNSLSNIGFNETGFDARQRRRLSQRQGVADYFDVGFNTSLNNARTQSIGGVAQNQSVGRSEVYPFDGSNAKVRRAQGVADDYARNAQKLSSTQRNIEQVRGFYNAVRPIAQQRDSETVRRNLSVADSVVDGISLASNWNNISDYRKFQRTAQGLLNVGRQLGFDLPHTGNALGILNFGYSASQLFDNWDQMTPEQRSVATLSTLYQGTQAYQAGNQLINGLSSKSGASLTGAKSQLLRPNLASSKGAVVGSSALKTGASALKSALGIVGGAYGAYNLIDKWGTGGAAGRANGTASGAAIGMSIYGPIGAAIGAVLGFGLGSIKTGKSIEQQTRDAFREQFNSIGLFEKRGQEGKLNVQLADGSFYDVSIDGGGVAAFNGQAKQASEALKGVEGNDIREDGSLRPYEVDYTNRLDYLTSLATSSVNILGFGGSRGEKEFPQMNGYLANAATSNLKSRELNEENFSQSMENVRGFYQKMGITSKDGALGLLRALKADDRVTQDDYNSAIIGINFAFDNNFDYAQAINEATS